MWTEREAAIDKCWDILRGKYHHSDGKVGSRVGRILQCLKETRGGEENEIEGLVRVDGSRAVTRVFKDVALSPTLELRLREYLRAQSERVQKNGLLRYDLVASTLPWVLWRLRVYVHIEKTWTRSRVNIYEQRLGLISLCTGQRKEPENSNCNWDFGGAIP